MQFRPGTAEGIFTFGTDRTASKLSETSGLPRDGWHPANFKQDYERKVVEEYFQVVHEPPAAAKITENKLRRKK